MMIPDLPDAEYRSRAGISKSQLDWLNRSPQHYRHYIDNPPKATPAMILGQAIHAAILEPKEYGKRFAFAPDVDRRTTGGKAAWAEFEAENAGKQVLSQQDLATVTGVAGSFHRNDLTAGLLGGTLKEASLFWQDPTHDNMACKARLDILDPQRGMVWDVKTTENASYGAFKYSVKQYRYHVQAAYYLDAVRHGLGVDARSFCLIAIEKAPPYGLAYYIFDEESIAIGRREYQANLQTYAHCLETNTWPGYSSQVMEMSIL